MPRTGLATALATCVAFALPAQSPPLRQFRNLNQTYHVDLPADWRQLAPNEARRLGEQAGAPRDLTYVEPRQFYAVGPVERWLAGDFSGPWLYVVEQGNEWMVGDDFAERLADMWRQKGEATGERHEVSAAQRREIGAGRTRALTARRTITPPLPGVPRTCLDVYAPAGGQQFTLSFVSSADEFARWEPEFERWLATAVFARASRGEQKLSDRLWTPLIAGAVVGIVLLVLYKHSKSRR